MTLLELGKSPPPRLLSSSGKAYMRQAHSGSSCLYRCKRNRECTHMSALRVRIDERNILRMDYALQVSV